MEIFYFAKKIRNGFILGVLFGILIFPMLGTTKISNVRGYTYFTGYVKDINNNALSGATLLLADCYGSPLGTTTTNSVGYYSLAVNLNGYSPYYLTASKTNYEPETKSVTSGGVNNFYLYLCVYGYVKDSQNVAISGASVKVYNNGILQGTATSQSSGFYKVTLSSVPTSGQIKAEKHGFRDYTQSISAIGSYNLYMNALKAIIVGISDYSSGTDLNYCDEDATDWYDQLYDIGYTCQVYGDIHTTNYPIYTGLATESIIRSAIQTLGNNVGSGDTVCFIFSGHGSTNILGKTYLYTQDCKQYTETEIEDDFDGYDSGVKIFFFFDSCNSGGIISSLDDMPNKEDIYVATTCTEDGYGYDGNPDQPNSLWTYYFLELTWVNHYLGSPSISMEAIFDYALSIPYPKTGVNLPQEYDGNTASSFYL